MSDQPMLPYGGQSNPNSGYSGSQTSRERAVGEDADGTTGARQRTTVNRLTQAGRYGMTYRELGEAEGWHHGQSSGVLSALHKSGVIVRLTFSRRRCRIYVMPQYAEGRATEPHGETATTVLLGQMAEHLRVRVGCAHGPIPEPGCWSCEVSELLRRYDASFNG